MQGRVDAFLCERHQLERGQYSTDNSRHVCENGAYDERPSHTLDMAKQLAAHQESCIDHVPLYDEGWWLPCSTCMLDMYCPCEDES